MYKIPTKVTVPRAHLKSIGMSVFSRFGDGYTVTLRIGGENPDLEGVSELIKSLFPEAVFKVFLSYYHSECYPWFHFTPQYARLL